MIEWTRLATRTGFKFQVRRARPADKAALGRFYQQVTPEDLRFRFLTSLKQVGHDRLVAMTQANNPLAEGFVAFEQDEGPIIAAGMLACDANLDVGEVAISIDARYKNRGVGWELLGHITLRARDKGVRTLQSLESRSNHSAIELEKQFGFTADSYPGDATLVMVQKILETP